MVKLKRSDLLSFEFAIHQFRIFGKFHVCVHEINSSHSSKKVLSTLCKRPKNTFIFLVRFGFLLVLCALCLQQFGTRTCQFAWYLILLECGVAATRRFGFSV